MLKFGCHQEPQVFDEKIPSAMAVYDAMKSRNLQIIYDELKKCNFSAVALRNSFLELGMKHRNAEGQCTCCSCCCERQDSGDSKSSDVLEFGSYEGYVYFKRCCLVEFSDWFAGQHCGLEDRVMFCEFPVLSRLEMIKHIVDLVTKTRKSTIKGYEETAILEFGAGSGMWARALSDMGIKIIATDKGDWKYDETEPLFHIEKLSDSEAAAKYGSKNPILFWSWMPLSVREYTNSMIKKGFTTMIFVGDPFQCTGTMSSGSFGHDYVTEFNYFYEGFKTFVMDIPGVGMTDYFYRGRFSNRSKLIVLTNEISL